MFSLNFANCMTVWYFCFSFLFLVCTENHPPTVIMNLLGNNSPSPITRRISTLYSNFYFYCSIRCLNNIYGRLRGRDRTTKIDLQLPMYQCLSLLTLQVRIPFMARRTQYNIIW